MLESLDSYEISISCTHCGNKIKKSIGWIKSNSDFICVCGTRIKLDADQFKSDIADVERSLSDLQRTIKGLNKE
jgi:copper chaperone CopZ